MKKLILCTTLSLAVLAAGSARVSAAAAKINDVDPSHWAYQAIQHLVDKGYMAVYDDDTFRGDKPVSRMVFAAALYKLIQDVGSGGVRMSGADANALQKLQDEFAGDIADYETRVAALEKKISAIEAGAVANTETGTQRTYEMGKRADEIEEKNKLQDRSLDILDSQTAQLSAALQKEKKARKSFQTLAIVGIIAAIAVGAGN